MLPRQLKEIDFGSGLNTKGDRRAQPEQLLDIATNVEFDDIGSLRCRYPFDAVRSAIVGGGTLANARKLAMFGDELVCFTVDSLYAWIPAENAWQLRGTHLAVATDEETLFAGAGDQFCCDRAELNGHVVYCWQTGSAVGTFTVDRVQIAVIDKASGSVVQPPTTLSETGLLNLLRPKLVALAGCVMVLTFGTDLASKTGLFVSKITLGPFAITNQPTSGAPFVACNLFSDSSFDAVRVPGQDRMYVAVNRTGAGFGTGYTIADCDENWTSGAATHALSPLGPISCAIDPTASLLMIARTQASSTSVFGDEWNVTAAGTSATFVQSSNLGTYGTGTALAQITAAYRLTQDSGRYRCYVFWSCDEASNAVFECRSVWLDSTGFGGSDAPFVYALGLGSHAFAHDSHVYIWGTFAGLSFAPSDPTGTHSELQNTFYLYRDDGLLVAKAVWGEGAGFHPGGWLPSVVTVDANDLAFMGGIRRIVPVGSNALNPVTGVDGYAERAPREVQFSFDANRARRCVQFGLTLYILGGLLLQYDGTQIVEVGFATYPWITNAVAGSGGVVAAAGYSYKATDRWSNSRGEVDRSTTATVDNYTLGASNAIVVSVPNLYITRKTGVAIEVWRTKGNPPPGAPFFLSTSQDPTVNTGNNVYLASNPTAIALASVTDNLTDAAISILPANPENGAALSAIEPPPATIVFADNQRIYLAGIPGYPNTVYYSKYRSPGSVVQFNDALTFTTPIDGGPIMAIDGLDGQLVVWCQTSTYSFAGAGFDDTGAGGNFQLARRLSDELGCVALEAYTYFDGGFVVKTSKGWFLLGRSLNYEYIGAGVYKYDGEAIYGMTVLTQRHQIRILTSGRILVFDTLVNQWAETSVTDGLDIIEWNGAPAYLTATGVRAELTTWDGYAGTDYTLTSFDVETSWIKFGAMQARAIVDFVQLLGEFRSTCVIRKRLAKDYEATSPTVWNYTTDETWTPSPGVVGSALQVRQSPRRKRCESLKARFTVTAADGVSPLGGPGARLTGIAILFANEPNAYSAVSSAQKQ